MTGTFTVANTPFYDFGTEPPDYSEDDTGPFSTGTDIDVWYLI